MERAELVRGLRAMADFFDAHTDVPGPSSLRVDIFVLNLDARKEMARIARSIGCADKDAIDRFFILRRVFSDGVSVEFNAYRDQVCRKVVTGKKLVEEQVIPARPGEIIPAHEVEEFEWQCDEPLLSSV